MGDLQRDAGCVRQEGEMVSVMVEEGVRECKSLPGCIGMRVMYK